MVETAPNTTAGGALTLLFVCTHNRCRSVLCEALTRHLSHANVVALSAGSQPSGAVHPDTLKHLTKRGIDVSGLSSTSWDVYEDVAFDVVITVCDNAAGEQCPVWLGDTTKVHWGLPDPSKIEGDEERDAAFDAVINVIEQRMTQLLTYDVDRLRGEELRRVLMKIAEEVV